MRDTPVFFFFILTGHFFICQTPIIFPLLSLATVSNVWGVWMVGKETLIRPGCEAQPHRSGLPSQGLCWGPGGSRSTSGQTETQPK